MYVIVVRDSGKVQLDQECRKNVKKKKQVKEKIVVGKKSVAG